jgi:hypothetical protein
MESELPPEPEPKVESAFAIGESSLAIPAMNSAPVPEAPTYTDRRTGLVVFGVFQVIMGLLAALMIPLMVLGAFMSRMAPGGAMRPLQYVATIVSYVALAATLITFGIGSILTKRWARALTLVTSWYWLILGSLITVLFTAILPVTFRSAMQQAERSSGAAAPSPELTTGVMAVILTIIILFAAFFLIIVPLVYVIFYSRRDVGETCRRRDPVQRWTDRTPLPVLGAVVLNFVGALFSLMTAVTTPLFPFFGRYLTGLPGGACFLAIGALDMYLAFALFRRQRSAWWIAILTVPVRILSMILTYGRADLFQAYSKIGVSDQQLQMMSANPIFRGHVILWWSLISMFIYFGYLLWLKRYFREPELPESTLPLAEPIGQLR